MPGDKAASFEAAFLCPGMDGLKIAPCIFRTPHVHEGRMLQRVRNGGATIGNLLSGKTLFVFNFRNLVGQPPALNSFC